MKFIHIVDGPPLYTNCFLLIGSQGHAVAIDPAAKAELFVKELEANNATLTHILLTHGHHDHIGSVEPLRSRYGAKLYMNAADARQFGLHPDVEYTDGETITVDDMPFTVIFTPGHTPGSTCLRCGNYLFSGDTLFAGDIGRTDLAGGSPLQMQQSLKKLLEKVPDNPQVLPGHEEFSTMAQERAENPYLRF
ncbi:MAG: MBL fold metallo-hydrolase [Oscillospiraceae bacterium]